MTNWSTVQRYGTANQNGNGRVRVSYGLSAAARCPLPPVLVLRPPRGALPNERNVCRTRVNRPSAERWRRCLLP
jgi:hypothetical protein